MLLNKDLIQSHTELLAHHINRGHDVFVDSFGRQPKPFTEYVEQSVPTDKTDHVVPTTLGSRQRMLRRPWGRRMSNSCLTQSHLRRASLQLGIAIPAVMFGFKAQRFSKQVLSVGHYYASQEPAAVMVIEFFYHPVSPGFSHGNKPKLDVMGQAKPNQTTDRAWMSMTAKENHFIVYLLML